MAIEPFFVIKIQPGYSSQYLAFYKNRLEIGRSVHCDIQIQADLVRGVLCHGKQCWVYSADNAVMVRGSSNLHGNYLNGVRIEGSPVAATPIDEVTLTVDVATLRICATTEESEALQEGRRQAVSPQTPAATLRSLSQTHDLKTILALLENPNTPPATLAALAVFSPRRFWQNPATPLFSMEDPALKLFSEHTLLALLESSYTPESLRERLVSHPSQNIQQYAAKHTARASTTERFDEY